jgi:hypothetical protein
MSPNVRGSFRKLMRGAYGIKSTGVSGEVHFREKLERYLLAALGGDWIRTSDQFQQPRAHRQRQDYNREKGPTYKVMNPRVFNFHIMERNLLNNMLNNGANCMAKQVEESRRLDHLES